MARKEVMVLVCDLCYREDEVEEHTASLDGRKVVIELCPRCLKKTETAFSKVIDHGRKPGTRPKKAPERIELPPAEPAPRRRRRRDDDPVEA